MLSDKLIWLRHQIYKRLVGTILPISWFGPKPPPNSALSMAQEPLQLQIVSHCWQYAHMLNFQLSSLINHPPQHLQLTYTLFYSDEDSELVELINRVNNIKVPNVTWQWIAVPKQELFRRAIGRNTAATTSQADWLWFSDCDLIFHKNCLDSLAIYLQSHTDKAQALMVYPRQEFITELLESTHPMLNQNNNTTVDIDTTLFSSNTISKAKGAFQIVHGDVARHCGYCRNMRMYQTPMQHWSKTYEDSIFRQLIGTEGEAIDVKGLFRIRHTEKGRYVKGSKLSELRRNIRVATDDAGTPS